MTKRAQSVFTGISDQADVALLYLLKAIKEYNFQKILIEGKNWEDFTLVFDDHVEDCEVKSLSRALNYSNIKNIISKETVKDYGEKDILRIITRRLDKKFKKDYEYIHESLYWWHSFSKKDYLKNSVVKRFLLKGWSEQEIAFLLKTKIVEFYDIENIYKQISEYFALEEPFYLDSEDIENISARTFKDIMSKGKKGEAISRADFINILDKFKRNIAEKSESFSPEISIGKKVIKLVAFLKTEREFNKLNRSKFLGPISESLRLIFYITDKLEQNEFRVEAFSFFLNKILLKQCYVRLAIRLLEKKREQGKVKDPYLISFLTKNYKRFTHDFNYDSALKMIKSVVQSDKEGKFEKKIISFMKEEILLPFQKEKIKRTLRKKYPWREDERIAEILKIFLERAKKKEVFIDFIFDYFDFTSDDFSNVVETHPLIYSFVKNFIKENIKINFDGVIRKVSSQFNIKYNGKYRGCEWIGGGISQMGSSYSIADKGIVRLLFQPLFVELYQSNPKTAWKFFKKRILDKGRVRATQSNPIYLKRALVFILLERLEKEKLNVQEKNEVFGYLKSILKMKGGIPQTSEIIFDRISRRDLNSIGFNRVMDLIEIDSTKYRRKDNPAGYPTNLFVISTLVNLIKLGYKSAKSFYINLLKKPDFIRRDRHYDSFELMVARGIPETDPDFIIEIFNNIDFEKYLDSFEEDIVWDKSGLISGLIKKDWQEDTTKGQQIVTRLLKNKIPSKKVLEFLAGPIRDLAQHKPVKAYNLLSPYLQNKDIFWKTFQNNSSARESIVSMAENLVKIKHYEEAKHIVDLCIDDPDPETDEKSEFNYHIKIKNGEKESLISSVRGKMAWLIQKFVISNESELMEYAFEKIKVLLDLDGALAKKLNYSEPDLYVRKQALVPLVELVHPGRRKRLNEYKYGFGDVIKQLAFDVLDITDKQLKSKEVNPKSIVEYLVSIFSYIRDLTTDEAKKILEFFEEHKQEEAHFLFVYFAVYRKNQYKEIPFESKYFEEKLSQICQENDDFRPSLAWEFWRTCDEDKEKNTKYFNNVEKYWKLLFGKYHHATFDDLYRTLEITLTNPAKYKEHKKLLKKAFKKEIEYLKTNKIRAQLWEPGKEIFQILKEHSDDDFLEVFSQLLEGLNENIHYFWIRDWVPIFKSIKPKKKYQKALCSKIVSKLKNLYPEYLESQ